MNLRGRKYLETGEKCEGKNFMIYTPYQIWGRATYHTWGLREAGKPEEKRQEDNIRMDLTEIW
jgi:hypothetical protein